MATYTLNLNVPPLPLRSGHLRLGGENRLGQSIGVTNQYLTFNGRPFFGVSGEFQFSRYPAEEWEQELLKIKAGGVSIIPTYVFWIHHEEQPGVFDWSGRRNLRHFVELCAKHGLWVIARIGPFAHGECRNGGLPDWLYGQPFPVRSNHPEYLALVERLYTQIGHQLRGLLFKDGGPVVAIQLENEYEHTGAPWDIADRSAPVEWLPNGSGLSGDGGGVEHMRRLMALAKKARLDAPLYTATGWGSPIIEDEILPVHGGYAYPTWVDNPGPSDLFLFYDRQAKAHPDVRYRTDYHYPLLNAEMQGGIQIRYNNRPVVHPRSTEALALVQIGCGSNFLGYYIYHGGSNPLQGNGYTNEILHPQVSYDFQAPISEYGEVREPYRGLKTLHLFLQSFGEQLAVMPAHFPEGSGAIDPSDTRTLRYAARSKDGRGFLFLNNFQDHLETQPIPGIRFRIELGGEANELPQAIELPHQGELTLQPYVSCILPLNLPLPGARLVYATAQPLTVIETEQESHYFFYAPEGFEPEYSLQFEEEAIGGEDWSLMEAQQPDASQPAASAPVGYAQKTYPRGSRALVRPGAGLAQSAEPGMQAAPGSTFSYTLAASGRRVCITTLTRQEAEHAYRGTAWGRKRLILCPAGLVFADGGVTLHSTGQETLEMLVFPPLDEAPAVRGAAAEHQPGELCSRLRLRIPPASPQVTVEPRGADKLLLRFPPEVMDGIHNLFVTVDYTGDIAGAYINGRLVADHYNNGTPWRFGIKRFIPGIFEHGLVLSFRPLRKGTIKNVSNAMAARMDFEGEVKLEIHGVTFTPEYLVRLG